MESINIPKNILDNKLNHHFNTDESFIIKRLYYDVFVPLHTFRLNITEPASVVVLERIHLKKINLSGKENKISIIRKEICNGYGDIVIDSNLQIESSNECTITRNDIAVRSSHNDSMLFFYFGEDAPEIFINGTPIPDLNKFNKPEDRNAFFRRFKISELDIAMKEYKDNHIKDQAIYPKFFGDIQELKKYYNINKKEKLKDKNVNLLSSDPEKKMQKDLIFFLKKHIDCKIINEEFETGDENRIDVILIGENKTVIIEIKWMGKRLLPKSYKCEIGKIDDGILQALKYLKSTTKEMHGLFKKGYLFVYDARWNIDELTAEDIKIIEQDLIKNNSEYKEIYDAYYHGTHLIKLDNLKFIS